MTKVASARQRFVTLDALRGVGAICVMAGHSGNLLGGFRPTHFYIAVDMFFLLSGFVIAHAYDDRFAAGLGLKAFLRARLRRLYPTYLVGLAIGVGCTFVVNSHALSNTQIVVSTLFAALGLPSPPMGPWKALFPLNGPFWSLFFEFWWANLAYAVLWKRIWGRRLWFLVIFSGLATLACAFIFRTADTGWNWHTFAGGAARVTFSFFAGVGLSRVRAARDYRISVPSWACLLLCILAFSLPMSGMVLHVYDVMIVLFFFPALIFFSAGATERRPYIGKLLGDLSYTVYAIHRPLAGLAALLAIQISGSGVSYRAAVCFQIAFTAFILALAWLINGIIGTLMDRGLPVRSQQAKASKAI